MRKIFILLLLCILLASCASKPADTVSDSSIPESSVIAESGAVSLTHEESSETPEEVSEMPTVQLGDVWLEATSYSVDVEFIEDRSAPPVLIRTVEEKKTYMEKYPIEREKWKDFVAAMEQYDEEFFHDNALLLAPYFVAVNTNLVDLCGLYLSADGVLRAMYSEEMHDNSVGVAERLCIAEISDIQQLSIVSKVEDYNIAIRVSSLVCETEPKQELTYLDTIEDALAFLGETTGSSEWRHPFKETIFNSGFALAWHAPEEAHDLRMAYATYKVNADGVLEISPVFVARDSRYESSEERKLYLFVVARDMILENPDKIVITPQFPQE